jgi:hypothetical protein
MVKTEESAEAVAPLHGGGRVLRRCRVLQKPVVESLMVSLAVVVLDVLPREEAQVAVTERDYSIETFLFDRPVRCVYSFGSRRALVLVQESAKTVATFQLYRQHGRPPRR